MFYRKYGKRIIDVLASGIGLIILSPVFLILFLLVRKKIGSPVIFKQKRPGKDERIFDMYKFRTMTDEKDSAGNLLPDNERLTPFGKKLRSTSLDELPELWNIFKGDMSIVGPRPQLVKDMWFMTNEQRKRHEVLPGLTGWAQVNGRNNISWEEKIQYDLEYIDNLSFFEDIKIICRTVLKVIKKEDISTDGMQTAEDLGDYLLNSNQISQSEYNKTLRRGENGFKL